MEDQHSIVLYKEAIAKIQQTMVSVEDASIKYAAITSRKPTGQGGTMCIKHYGRVLC